MATTQQQEWAILNYLTGHEIYAGHKNTQKVIINSFFLERGGNPKAEWKEKITFTQDHFGLFCQYAHNKWKTPIVQQELETKVLSSGRRTGKVFMSKNIRIA